MKKKLFVAMLVLIIATSFIGCSNGSGDSNAADSSTEKVASDSSNTKELGFTIAIVGVDGKTQLTQADVTALPVVEKTIKMTKKDGSETGGVFKGYALKDVVKELGVTDYASINMEASDGYAKSYDKATVEAEDSLLTTFLDGEELVSIVAGSMGSSAWIKDISKMSVTK
ncbi:MAG: hypothetical protein ACOH15_04210 [Acetobacterium sp.]